MKAILRSRLTKVGGNCSGDHADGARLGEQYCGLWFYMADFDIRIWFQAQPASS